MLRPPARHALRHHFLKWDHFCSVVVKRTSSCPRRSRGRTPVRPLLTYAVALRLAVDGLVPRPVAVLLRPALGRRRVARARLDQVLEHHPPGRHQRHLVRLAALALHHLPRAQQRRAETRRAPKMQRRAACTRVTISSWYSPACSGSAGLGPHSQPTPPGFRYLPPPCSPTKEPRQAALPRDTHSAEEPRRGTRTTREDGVRRAHDQ